MLNNVGIPIAELVAAPLVAECDSQKELAQSAYEFMTEIGFKDEGRTRMVEFDLLSPMGGTRSSGYRGSGSVP